MLYSKKTGGFYDETIHTKEQIPDDVVSVTDDQYHALFDAQSSGKQITADSNGKPVATDYPLPTVEELAVSARAKRDMLITATDYLLMSDYPITAEELALVKTYRQLLRDITKQIGFPTNIDWPTMPE